MMMKRSCATRKQCSKKLDTRFSPQPSAQQGLRLATMCKCDAVLLDYEMPGMNGHEVASEIKRIRPELIIILLSGSDIPTQALALVDAFVPKLEASRQLLPMIAELCSQASEGVAIRASRFSE